MKLKCRRMILQNSVLIAIFWLYIGNNFSFASNGNEKNTVRVTISGNGDLQIPQNQIPLLEDKALRGSGDAAHKLASFYFFVKSNRAAGLYWETISAENGNSLAMCSLGSYMIAEKKGYKTDLRARFWIERAKKAGIATAILLLRQLDRDRR
jgi:TPR repeat protein